MQKSTNMRVDLDTWKRIKIEATLRGIGIGDVVNMMLDVFLKAGMSKLGEYKSSVEQ